MAYKNYERSRSKTVGSRRSGVANRRSAAAGRKKYGVKKGTMRKAMKSAMGGMRRSLRRKK